MSLALRTIWIICDDESHKSKICRVNFVMDDQSGRWVCQPGSSNKRGEFADMVSLDVDNKRLAPRPAEAERLYETQGRQRRHFNFKCELCAHNEVRARAETLSPIFDTLADNDISCVSLNALAARIRSTQ